MIYQIFINVFLQNYICAKFYHIELAGNRGRQINDFIDLINIHLTKLFLELTKDVGNDYNQEDLSEEYDIAEGNFGPLILHMFYLRQTQIPQYSITSDLYAM